MRCFPADTLDTVVPTAKQKHGHALSLLAYSSTLGQLVPSHCAVMLDLSRVGGHYHTSAVPCDLTLQGLLLRIDKHIWYRIEAVDVWVDDAGMPASEGTLAVAPGTVFTVLLKGERPDPACGATQVLCRRLEWGPLECSPKPRRAAGDAVAVDVSVRPLPHSMLSPLSFDQAARAALGLREEDVVLSTQAHLHLDLHGDQCHTVHAGCAPSRPWLLDLRPLGLPPQILRADCEPSAFDVAVCLPCRLPESGRLVIQDVSPPFGDGPSLSVLRVHFETIPGVALSLSDPGAALNCKGPSEATSPLRAAVQSVVDTAQLEVLPEPFLRIGETSPIHEHTVGPGGVDDEDAEEVGRALPVTALLFTPELTPEEVHLTVPVPCTVEDVLRMLVDECDDQRYSLFPHHIPVEPQPSQWWIAFLALPAWAAEEPVILVNLTAVDGRCFATAAPNPISRAQILRLADLPDDGTLEVFPFLAFEPMHADARVPLVAGGTVAIRRAGARRVVQGFFLNTMLLGGTMWLADPDLPTPPVGNRSLLVHGHGHGLVHPRANGFRPSAEEVAAVCGAQPDTVRVVDALLVPSDATCLGYYCHRVFGVAFSESNHLADGQQHAFVAFVDCRALLQGWSLELTADGRVRHSELIDWLDTFSPDGWQPQIDGAPVENDFLITQHGSVLVASYVPVTSSEEAASVSSRGPSSPAGDADGDDDADSDSTPSPDEGPTGDLVAHTRDRSRSPAGRFSSDDVPPAGAHQHPFDCSLSLWYIASFHDASVHGRRCITSVILLSLLPVVSARPGDRDGATAQLVPSLLIGTLFLFLRQLLIVSKQLSEPCPLTTRARFALAALRYLAPRLGEAWRYTPAPDAIMLTDVDPAEEDSSASSERLCWCHFVVLMLGFAPFSVEIALWLPTTVADTVPEVQRARTREHVRLFPRLVPVSHQPFPGSGVFIGCPAWHHAAREGHALICVDTHSINGKFFVASVPVYICRQHLFVVAEITPCPEICVFVGNADTPLEADSWCNVVTGDTVSFYADHAERGESADLHSLLASPPFLAGVRAPSPQFEDALYLVHKDGNLLHALDLRRPTRYREHLAAAIGARAGDLRLFPASPRVQDVCIAGVICRTVLAVVEIRNGPPVRSSGCLLDLRAPLAGWNVLEVFDGQISCPEVLASLVELVPLGWRAKLRGVPVDQPNVAAAPGQVFVVDLVPAISPSEPAPADGPEETGLGAPTAGDMRARASENRADETSRPGPSELSGAASSRAAEVVGPSLLVVDSSLPEDSIAIPLLVFAPEFVVEQVVIHTRIPVTLDRVLRLLRAGREAERVFIFPNIVPVPVQPALPAACFIAMPIWQTHGVPALFACFVPPVRVFAQVVPGTLSADDVLRIAGVDPAYPVHIYVGDVPWAVPDGGRFDVNPGSLIAIFPVGQPVIPPLSLQSMLLSRDGWRLESPLPVPTDEQAWVVPEQAPFHATIPRSPTFTLQVVVAGLMHVPLDSVRLLPAMPAVRDHAHSGIMSRQVYAFATGDPEDGVPYLLDLRRLLLPICLLFAPGGRMDIDSLWTRLRSRCPAGFFMRVHGGFALAMRLTTTVPFFQDRLSLPNSCPVALGVQPFLLMLMPLLVRTVMTSGLASTGLLLERALPCKARLLRSGLMSALVACKERPTLCAAMYCGVLVLSTTAVDAGNRHLTSAQPHQSYPSLAFRVGWPRALAGVVSRMLSSFFGHLLRCTVAAFACADWLSRAVLRRPAVCVLLVLIVVPYGVVGVQFFDLSLGEDAHVSVPPPSSFPRASDEGCVGFSDGCAIVDARRFIPTPCRSLALAATRSAVERPPIEDTVVGSDALITLLEQSRRRYGDGTFFEARVLLDTLTEHFQEVGEVLPAASPPPVPFQLSLSALLDTTPAPLGHATRAGPVPWHDLSHGSCVTPLTDVLSADLRRFSPILSSGLLPHPLDKPYRFQRWVAEGSPGIFPSDATEVCLTSDGSFSASTGSAGWGLVLSALTPSFPRPPGQFVGVAYGPTRAVWDFGGNEAGPVNAYASELVGLLWASIAAFQCKFCGPVTFFCDNLAALGAAQGTCAAPGHSVAAACRDLHQGLTFSEWGPPRYSHVRGHAGDSANELADAIAARGADGFGRNPFSLDFAQWFQQHAFKWIPHFCWALRYPSEGPGSCDGVIQWSSTEPPMLLDAEDVMLPFTRAAGTPSAAPAGDPILLQFSVASFNTLSIVEPGKDSGTGSGLYGCTGRAALLDGALDRHGVFFAGLQETRTPAGEGCSLNYKRYSSGCLERRAFGIELWVATSPRWPTHTVVVLHTDYTRLCARLSFSGLQLCVLVGHAPHSGHTLDSRREWWRETAELCSRFGLDEDWVLLLDANCKVGSVCSEHIGPLHADPFDEIGELFHDLVRKCGAWLPSTFDGSFVGDGGTLVQRRSGALARSDYVALPCGWNTSSVLGRVEPTISAGHAVLDHFAVVVDVQLCVAPPVKHSRAPRIDGQALLKPENEEAIARICAAVPSVAWDVSVHDHSAVVVDALYDGLSRAFPLKGRRLGKHYLTDETAEVHHRTAVLRHALRWRLVAYRSAVLRCAFVTWAGDKPFIAVFTGRWLHQLRLSIALSSMRLSTLGREVRRLCRRDRAAFFSALAEEADAAPPGQVHTAIKKVLRPKKFRRGGPQPLPRLKRPDGSLCTTADEVADEWRRHFASLEGGACVSVPDLVAGCVQRQRRHGALEGVPASEMPSFCDLVASLRDMRPHRAAGPDLLPPSLCARFALPVARLLWPILLKSMMFATEGIGLKGGTLHHIAKASSPNSSFAADQRGILLQPVFGKAIHKTLRRLPAALFERRACR